MRFGVLVPLSTLAAAILAMILGRSPDGIILGGLAVLVPVVNAILRRIGSNGPATSMALDGHPWETVKTAS